MCYRNPTKHQEVKALTHIIINLFLQLIDMIGAASKVGLQDETKPERYFRIVQLRFEVPEEIVPYSLVPPGPCKKKTCQRTVQVALILQRLLMCKSTCTCVYIIVVSLIGHTPPPPSPP